MPPDDRIGRIRAQLSASNTKDDGSSACTCVHNAVWRSNRKSRQEPNYSKKLIIAQKHFYVFEKNAPKIFLYLALIVVASLLNSCTTISDFFLGRPNEVRLNLQASDISFKIEKFSGPAPISYKNMVFYNLEEMTLSGQKVKSHNAKEIGLINTNAEFAQCLRSTVKFRAIPDKQGAISLKSNDGLGIQFELSKGTQMELQRSQTIASLRGLKGTLGDGYFWAKKADTLVEVKANNVAVSCGHQYLGEVVARDLELRVISQGLWGKFVSARKNFKIVFQPLNVSSDPQDFINTGGHFPLVISSLKIKNATGSIALQGKRIKVQGYDSLLLSNGGAEGGRFNVESFALVENGFSITAVGTISSIRLNGEELNRSPFYENIVAVPTVLAAIIILVGGAFGFFFRETIGFFFKETIKEWVSPRDN